MGLVVILDRAKAVQCDHAVKLTLPCPLCEAESMRRARFTLSLIALSIVLLLAMIVGTR